MAWVIVKDEVSKRGVHHRTFLCTAGVFHQMLYASIYGMQKFISKTEANFVASGFEPKPNVTYYVEDYDAVIS